MAQLLREFLKLIAPRLLAQLLPSAGQADPGLGQVLLGLCEFPRRSATGRHRLPEFREITLADPHEASAALASPHPRPAAYRHRLESRRSLLAGPCVGPPRLPAPAPGPASGGPTRSAAPTGLPLSRRCACQRRYPRQLLLHLIQLSPKRLQVGFIFRPFDGQVTRLLEELFQLAAPRLLAQLLPSAGQARSGLEPDSSPPPRVPPSKPGRPRPIAGVA